MKVTFADSFHKSLKKLIMQQTWWYKTYDFVTRGIPRFFRNIYKFRKELYEHQWWDYHFTLQMLHRSLVIQEKGMREKGMEVSETLEKKLESMQRAIYLLENKLKGDYVERAEAEVGPLSEFDFFSDEEPSEDIKKQDRLVFDVARELEEAEWTELWKIIKGTKNSKKAYKNKKYDGTDLRAWWD
jgi:hypothetical protein